VKASLAKGRYTRYLAKPSKYPRKAKYPWKAKSPFIQSTSTKLSPANSGRAMQGS